MLKITLEDLFHSPGQIGVLRVLFRSGTPLTGRQVQRLSGLANLSTMRALKRLADLGVVSCRRAGRAYQYELRRSHWAVENLISPLFENEGKGLDLAVEIRPIGRHCRQLPLKTQAPVACEFGENR